jgi:hypothetical protein
MVVVMMARENGAARPGVGCPQPASNADFRTVPAGLPLAPERRSMMFAIEPANLAGATVNALRGKDVPDGRQGLSRDRPWVLPPWCRKLGDADAELFASSRRQARTPIRQALDRPLLATRQHALAALPDCKEISCPSQFDPNDPKRSVNQSFWLGRQRSAQRSFVFPLVSRDLKRVLWHSQGRDRSARHGGRPAETPALVRQASRRRGQLIPGAPPSGRKCSHLRQAS